LCRQSNCSSPEREFSRDALAEPWGLHPIAKDRHRPCVCGAGWLEQLGFGKQTTTDQPSALAATVLSQDQMASSLKEALGKGVEHAVGSLGKEDGFLKDLSVKIPLPDTMKKVESRLRMLGQDKLADDFVTTMNRAAEKAVPEAAAVLGDSMKQMTPLAIAA